MPKIGLCVIHANMFVIFGKKKVINYQNGTQRVCSKKYYIIFEQLSLMWTHRINRHMIAICSFR